MNNVLEAFKYTLLMYQIRSVQMYILYNRVQVTLLPLDVHLHAEKLEIGPIAWAQVLDILKFLNVLVLYADAGLD